MIIMFKKNSEVKSDFAGDGATRKVLSYGDNVMNVEVSFEKNAVGSLHTHSHEQISYVVSGSFEYELDGDKSIMTKGDTVYIAPNVLHGCKALEENSVLLDTFSPIREDFLK